MAYQQKDNSGSLFRNDKKETDNHPDFNGSCVIGGREYWISAWTKVADSGRKYMSFSFKPKDAQQPQQRPQARQEEPRNAPRKEAPRTGTSFDDMDSDVPF